jgi:hypothetical protein
MLYPTVTSNYRFGWQAKIKEIRALNLREVCVFPETLLISERKKLYAELLNSPVKRVPLVHIRDDFQKWELEFFFKHYQTRHFNVHERSFDNIKSGQWRGFQKFLYLEYNYDNRIARNVEIGKIRGLCLDLGHFWSAKDRGTKEFERCQQEIKRYKIGANHLSGYDKIRKKDRHTITSLAFFDYLKEVPQKYYSNLIAIEVYNPIKEQLKFKRYIEKIIN